MISVSHPSLDIFLLLLSLFVMEDCPCSATLGLKLGRFKPCSGLGSLLGTQSLKKSTTPAGLPLAPPKFSFCDSCSFCDSFSWLPQTSDLAESLLHPCLTRRACSGMALAQVFYKEQGEKANPILHGNGSPVPLEPHDIDEKMMYSSCAETHHVWHQDCVAGKPSRWFSSSAGGCCKAERTAKMIFQDYIGM